jgi:baculoviral IAP repeat-containing protein 6
VVKSWQAKDNNIVLCFSVKRMDKNKNSATVTTALHSLVALLVKIDAIAVAAEVITIKQPASTVASTTQAVPMPTPVYYGKKGKKGKAKLYGSNYTGYGQPSVAGSGVGYGGNAGERINTSTAASKEGRRDNDVLNILLQLNDVMRTVNYEINAANDGLVTLSVVQSVNETLRGYLNVPIYSHSGLRWLLNYYLHNDSLVDIGSRELVYREVLSFITLIANGHVFVDILLAPLLKEDNTSNNNENPDDTVCCCLTLLSKLDLQAAVFVKLNEHILRQQGNDATDEDDNSEIVDAVAMALHIKQTYEDVKNHAEFAMAMGIVLSSASDKRIAAVASPAVAQKSPAVDAKLLLTREYVKQLGEKRFEAVEMIETINQAAALGLANCSHVFLQPSYTYHSNHHNTAPHQPSGHHGKGSNSSSSSAPAPKYRLSRIAKEMSSLLTNLPVEFASSIFVRCDENRHDILKALIIGPEGTPYENGCFEFDIMLPTNYPDAPPLVKLTTTGGGTVRFNPNLYNCGKVCLSLLGMMHQRRRDCMLTSVFDAQQGLGQVLVGIRKNLRFCRC